MKALHVGIASFALVSLVGCSSMGLGNKRIDYRGGAEQATSLEVPPDLTSPEIDDRYRIPEGNGESIATYSAYTGNEGTAPSRVVTKSPVLPVVAGVTLERNGTQRWLSVQERAENVWPVIKDFLRESGLNIQNEDQAAGLIETEWAENRAKIPQGGIRSVVGKVFDNLYSSGERDQYRIRLERAKEGAATEIYITHRGKEEMLDAEKNFSKWQSRPNDPTLEAEMLQRLMVKFGSNPTQAAVAVSDGAGVATGAANLMEIFDGSSVIVINDAFDRSWRRVGLAIERAGLSVEDMDRTKGIYFLRKVKPEKSWMDSLQFWKDDVDSNAQYRVIVKDGGVSCEVSVTDQNGVTSDASKQRLQGIFKHINQ